MRQVADIYTTNSTKTFQKPFTTGCLCVIFFPEAESLEKFI